MTAAEKEPIYWVDLDDLAMISRYTTAARGIDYYAVEHCHFTMAEWAEMTDRNKSTVSRNVAGAREDIP